MCPKIAMSDDFRKQFVQFSLDTGVLRFGSFTTKAGRNSPYFFNAGLFNSGARLAKLADFYALTLLGASQQGLQYDMLFGPAYKGIVLAAAASMALASHGLDIPYAYNRKEAKDHGEGGLLVGAPLKGRVVIVDDVISAGTSVRESVEIIRKSGATPAAVLIALDRMERGGDAVLLAASSAVQEVQRMWGIPVYAIATLADLLDFLAQSDDPVLGRHHAQVAAYRSRYGVEVAG